MKESDLNEKQMRMYNNMMAEINAKMKHINAGSYQTRYRYLDSMKLFAKVMIVGFHKNNLNRVRVKHVQYFADYMKGTGYSNSSITTNLSAIRFYFNQIKPNVYIPSNKELNVKPRSKAERINVNRAMPEKQYVALIALAISMNREDYVLKLRAGYLLGLRVHEIIGIRKSDIRVCLNKVKKYYGDNENEQVGLKVKGKGGLIRYVPIDTEEKKELLENILDYGNGKDDRLFVEKNKMHELIKDFQQFIRDNRDKDAEYKVTPHSLRHAYAQNEYKKHLHDNNDEKNTKLNVAQNLGHGRSEITDIYIESIEDWNEFK